MKTAFAQVRETMLREENLEFPLETKPTVLIPCPREKTFDEDEQRYESALTTVSKRVREIMEDE